MKFPGFIGPSFQGQSRSTDAERTINLLLEQVESGQSKDPTQYSFVKTPGLKSFLTIPSVPSIRGILPVSSALFFMVAGPTFYVVANGQIISSITGLITGNLPVSMAALPPFTNGGIPTQVSVCTETSATYIVNLTNPLVPVLIPVTQFGGAAISGVAFNNQFGLFLSLNTPGFFFSNPGDLTTGNSLNFISAESSANQWQQIISDKRNNVWLFGNQVTQAFYNNAAVDPNNPFLPNQSAGLQYGSVGRFSAIEWAGRIGWLSRDSYGQGMFVATDGGFIPHRVSNRAVEYIWSQYSTIQDAITYSITIKGHELVRIYFPSGNSTWEYDPATGDWHEVLFFNPISGLYEPHLLRCAAAFGDTIVGGSRRDGTLYFVNIAYQDDDLAGAANGSTPGGRIRWMRRAPIISNENKFTSYPWFELDMQFGVGDGSNQDPLMGAVSPEANPVVDMRISNDWGNTFGPSRSRSMGALGEYTKRMIWTRCGMARQRVFEISGSASVPTVINGAYLRQPKARTT